MNTEAGQQDPILWQQLFAVLLAVVASVVYYFLANLLMVALHYLQGSGDSILNRIFRDVAGPFVGAWLGISLALSCFKRSTAHFVFFGFAVAMLLLIGAALALGFLAVAHGKMSIWSVAWAAVCLAASLFGAYWAAEEKGFSF